MDLVRFVAGGEPVNVHAHRTQMDSDHWNNYNTLIAFDPDDIRDAVHSMQLVADIEGE